ncbi:hypothetical protein J2S42_005922 [Catenuloplanes indicus]|uniref:Uncharacterized protein n=1 Tax=Catenuloplanes indicus TaxID=137267 RepID=A0AAE3W3E5_9ACTN|nr:hypothetical protein [Catenuloplanes indicus]
MARVEMEMPPRTWPVWPKTGAPTQRMPGSFSSSSTA